MSNTRLRLVLSANAISSMLTGFSLVGLASVVAPYLGLSAHLLRAAGAGLVPFAALVVALARKDRPDGRLVALVSAADFTWVLASVLVVLSAPLTLLGKVAVLAIALVVEVFGTMQLVYARRRDGSFGETVRG